ncbi:MAG TPA: vWA domain-containing protein [Kofleriaceae bacterium]|jgi:hypothetical protein|nr:vWA domain-containing protein [Kofleriaceae bacterium]
MGNLLRAVVVVSLLGGVAAADSWEPAHSPSPEIWMRQDGPIVTATVYNAVLPRNDAIDLSVVGDQRRHVVTPLSVKPYANGDEPMAIMFVMSGQEIWVGNDSFEEDRNIRCPDTLGAIERAIERLDLEHRVPVGSRAGIVTYANGATVRMPLQPIETLHGSSFGTQHDYYNQIGTELVAGIEVGMLALEASPASRKLLVVIGDGNDTDSDRAAPRLLLLKKRAAQAGIRVESIIYKSRFSDDHNDVTRFKSNSKMVLSAEALGVQLETSIEDATHIFYATFDVRTLPVWNRPSLVELTMRIDGQDADPVAMDFPTPPAPPAHAPWWKALWAQLVLGLAGVGALVCLARRAAR